MMTVRIVTPAEAVEMTLEDGGGCDTVHIVAGRLIATEEGGDTLDLGPGDVATFPPGWRGEWRFPEPMRKLYTVFKG